LIEIFKISYAPSSSILLFLLSKQSNLEFSRGLLAFGNPSNNFLNSNERENHNGYFETFKQLYLNSGFVFSPLPYSGKEIFKISKYFSPEERDLFLKNKAKEDVLNEIIRSNYKIIHFACHALLDEKFPFRSALILSSDKDSNEDGFLQVREIYNLNLNAELVVLSACQTGKGKLEKGEGILGFPRIFFCLGAKSVLLSLWKINDESTSHFMNYFYYYLSKRYSKVKALRLAKLRMLKSKFRHPFYWAAFILNGDFNSYIIFN
jgi:CHAT domain-containing protein